jgi:hypothetical protein
MQSARARIDLLISLQMIDNYETDLLMLASIFTSTFVDRDFQCVHRVPYTFAVPCIQEFSNQF